VYDKITGLVRHSLDSNGLVLLPAFHTPADQHSESALVTTSGAARSLIH